MRGQHHAPATPYPRERPGTHCTGGWVGLRASLDRCGKSHGHEDSTHYIHAYTDGSKNEAGVGSGIAIFSGSNLKTTLKYRLNEKCTNNQAEQMAILKALEYIQHLGEEEKTVLVYTDKRITLQLLQNQK